MPEQHRKYTEWNADFVLFFDFMLNIPILFDLLSFYSHTSPYLNYTIYYVIFQILPK